MTSKLDANQLARQRKKIEKDRRRKVYDDQQVQGTNNSSIVSKRSVEQYYSIHLQPELGEWFKYFVKQRKFRRSPAINRGYWIRMESIRNMIVRIFQMNQDRDINVINLGCGFDPLPFQLLTMFPKLKNLNFIDIDYPDLINNKMDLISQSNEIMDLIGDYESDDIFKIKSSQYQLIGCDLKDLNYYETILEKVVSESSVNIFIAEVSLAYMKPMYANPVIEISSRLAKNCHFLILEQIIPDGKLNPFAIKMLYHFDHLRSPIQCVESYNNKKLQVERFKRYFPHVEINNLFENWKYLINDEMKHKVNQIEQFDEWEEFILFCQHYVLVHSTNMDQQLIFKKESEFNEEYQREANVKFKHIGDKLDQELLELKFPAVNYLNGKLIVNGGLKQTRTDETMQIDLKNNTVEKLNSEHSPIGRMCHSLTRIDHHLIMIGGRTKPGEFMSDVYKINEHSQWSRLKDLPCPRSRHSVVKIDNQNLLIFGGLKQDNEQSPFILYNIESEQVKELEVKGDNPGNLRSSSLTFENGVGYIYGGLINHDLPEVSNTLYKFKIDKTNNSVHVEAIFNHYLLSRIGSQGKILNNGNILLIVGGISSEQILTNQTSIMTLSLDTAFKFKSVEIDEKVREEHSPLFIGFSLVDVTENKSLVLGGGAVCYSFGSYFNSVYEVEYSL